jgi:multiple sugar transport system ATP-binding protein
MAAVRFRGVHKRFGLVPAVEELDLEIDDGEFLVVVGPSGCGKSTTLRMLAGLERPSSGLISIGDRVVNLVSPKSRDVAVVFQNYALYPHMTVYDNLSFGMRIRREPREHIRRQVSDVAQQLGLSALLDRRPAALSGGERQRVAVGRAMLRRPQVFLMDEPLSNLDATLRVHMRGELSRLHARVGITTFYVTHDQIEAMTLGDRIAVMRAGRLQQVASPETLYDEPVNMFVAGFIGAPRMNFLPARVAVTHGRPRLDTLSIQLDAGVVPFDPAALRSERIVLGIRPEDVRWSREAPAASWPRLRGVVEIIEPVGSETYVTVQVENARLLARFPPRAGLRLDEQVELALDQTRVHVFDAETEQAVPRLPVAGMAPNR